MEKETATAPIGKPKRSLTTPLKRRGFLTIFLTLTISVFLVLSYAVFSAGLAPASSVASELPEVIVTTAPSGGPSAADTSTGGRTPFEFFSDPLLTQNTVAPVPAQPEEYASLGLEYPDAATPQGVKEPGRGYFFGEENTDKTILLWIDPQCPSCAFLHKDIGEPLREAVNRGVANVEYFVGPFLGEGSAVAANALGCASDQGKFEEFLDYAYAYQREADRTGSQLTQQDMLAWGDTLGIGKSEYVSCVKNSTYNEYVGNILNIGAKAGIYSIPAVYVNGEDILANLTTFPAFLETIGLPADSFPLPTQ